MHNQPAFAAYNNKTGLLDIRTVSDTERAAKVNCLVLSMDVRIYQRYTDEDINLLWNNFTCEDSPDNHWSIVPVTVTYTPDHSTLAP